MRKGDGLPKLRELLGAHRLSFALRTAAAAHPRLRQPASLRKQSAAFDAEVEGGGDPHEVQQLPGKTKLHDVRGAFFAQLYQRAPEHPQQRVVLAVHRCLLRGPPVDTQRAEKGRRRLAQRQKVLFDLRALQV